MKTKRVTTRMATFRTWWATSRSKTTSESSSTECTSLSIRLISSAWSWTQSSRSNRLSKLFTRERLRSVRNFWWSLTRWAQSAPSWSRSSKSNSTTLSSTTRPICTLRATWQTFQPSSARLVWLTSDWMLSYSVSESSRMSPDRPQPGTTCLQQKYWHSSCKMNHSYSTSLVSQTNASTLVS